MAKILIVDDAAFMRMEIKKTLNPLGHQFVEAANGIEAIDMYKKTKPDLVLMDITMPEMNGIAALSAIKEIDNDAKVIMLTAMGQQQIVVETIQKGALTFIVKPFEEAKLVETISKFI